MTTIERALNSIGKKCFVEYYEDFKNCPDKETLANKLLVENIAANSKPAQFTRINYALWIFENKFEQKALEIIISSKRIDSKTISKAQKILRSFKH